jgi:N-acetyl-D-muramate 6-phosphate phosphatase
VSQGVTAAVPARALLFDLDGTLIDSAPDLAGAANDLRALRGLPPCAYETLRPMVGSGARGMVGAAFGVVPGDADFDDLRDQFLAVYMGRLLRLTRVFEAMEPVLQALESRGLAWGIVTNKAERFTRPVVEGLGLGDHQRRQHAARQAASGASARGSAAAHRRPGRVHLCR